MKKKTLLRALMALVTLASACGGAADNEADIAASVEATVEALAAQSPTSTPEPQPTSEPTDIPEPLATPVPERGRVSCTESGPFYPYRPGLRTYEEAQDLCTNPPEPTPTPEPGNPLGALGELICESVGDVPADARVIEARGMGQAIKAGLEERVDAEEIFELLSVIDLECESPVPAEYILGLAGIGRWSLLVEITEDRGFCGPRGDLGGVINVDPTIGSGEWDVRVRLKYFGPDGVLERDSEEFLTTEPGVPVAWESFLPSDLPTGGACEVTLESVAPS